MRNEHFLQKHALPFAELRYTRGSTAHFKPHMHHTLGIGAVEEGEVLYHVNGDKSLLRPGSLVIINPETLHACNPAEEAERSYFMLHLDTAWCCHRQHILWGGGPFVNAENIRIDDSRLYGQYCETMTRMMDESVSLDEKERLLSGLMAGIFSVACRPLAGMKEGGIDIEKLKLILSRDLEKELPINSLAEKIDANPYTLIRSFKSITGITPHAYRMSCRIEKARALLRQGLDITETALECGFFDQSHFHRHFKAMTTVTPREYRVNFVQ